MCVKRAKVWDCGISGSGEKRSDPPRVQAAWEDCLERT